MQSYLDFEKPVAELEAKADELRVVAEHLAVHHADKRLLHLLRDQIDDLERVESGGAKPLLTLLGLR